MNIGIDIVENKRLENKSKNFIDKVLTAEEIKIYDNLTTNKLFFLAGRFAAKEAVIKALNGIENYNMSQISILKNEGGAPVCKIHDNHKVKVSISHEKDYTVAVAIVE